MRSPNYVKFVDYFEEQFRKSSTQTTTYLSTSESLALNLTQVRNNYKFLLSYSILIFCGIIAISTIIFYFVSSQPIADKILTGLATGGIIGLIVYWIMLKKTHLNFTKSYFFTILFDRIKKVSEFINNKNLNYTDDEIIELLKSSSPFLDIKEKTACQVYYELNQQDGTESKKYTNIEKLYLFYLFLVDEGFDFKTSNKEFNYILGAILNTSPKSLRAKKSTDLNKLKDYYFSKGDLSQDDIKNVKDILQRIKVKANTTNFIEELLAKTYIP